MQSVSEGGSGFHPSLTETLDDLSHGRLTGAGGWSAAHAGVMAAALVSMIARTVGAGWTEAGGAIAQADALRRRLSSLADLDSAAYVRARDLLALAGQHDRGTADSADGQRRDRELSDALRQAAEVPLAIAETAADVAALAAWAARAAGDQHRPDAIVAACLAEAGCDAAATLVEVNLAVASQDQLATRAVAASRAAKQSRAEAQNRNR